MADSTNYRILALFNGKAANSIFTGNEKKYGIKPFVGLDIELDDEEMVYSVGRGQNKAELEFPTCLSTLGQ